MAGNAYCQGIRMTSRAIDVDPRSADFARSAEVAAGPRWKPRPDPPSANEWLAACHGSVHLMPG